MHRRLSRSVPDAQTAAVKRIDPVSLLRRVKLFLELRQGRFVFVVVVVVVVVVEIAHAVLIL